MHKIICIVGPTASGKTSLAIALAKKHNGEIISADSMQIYKGMDIGTAKPSLEELDMVPHHMIDFLPPDKNFSVSDYVKLASEIIEHIVSRGRTPFIVGGTGLYIKSLVDGLSFSGEGCDEAYRSELKDFADKNGNEALWRILKESDPVRADEIHPNNIKRVIRALEIYKQTGIPMSCHRGENRVSQPRYNPLFIGLSFSDRSTLYGRINDRVDNMFSLGLRSEAGNIINLGLPENCTAMQAIGYKEFRFFNCDEVISDEIKKNSRNYAKRQLTWFSADKRINWLEASGGIGSLIENASRLIDIFLL